MTQEKDRDAIIARAVEILGDPFEDTPDGPTFRLDTFIGLGGELGRTLATAAIESKIVELIRASDSTPHANIVADIDQYGAKYEVEFYLGYGDDAFRSAGPLTDRLFIASEALCWLVDQMRETPKKGGERLDAAGPLQGWWLDGSPIIKETHND